jgi:hypothetical protein
MVAPAPSAVKHPGDNVCQRAKHVLSVAGQPGQHSSAEKASENFARLLSFRDRCEGVAGGTPRVFEGRGERLTSATTPAGAER